MNDTLNPFGTFSDEDFENDFAPLLFTAKEPVVFFVEGFEPKPDHNILILKTTVLNGEHKEKKHDIVFSYKFRKPLVDFLRMYYSDEEIKAGIGSDYSKIITTEFTATPTAVKKEKYQNWYNFELIEGQEKESEETPNTPDF